MGKDSRNSEDMHGYFVGKVFSNGDIMVKIKRNYAVIKEIHTHRTLVERVYPVVEIKSGKGWREMGFEKRFMESSIHNGWHVLSIGFVHRGKIEVRGTLEYYQRSVVKEGAPLYPLFTLHFNRSVEYRVVWRYEGIGSNWFEVIDNGTGYTRVPYREGHGRTGIYNGTVRGERKFEDGQDMVKVWRDGDILFGLNWERSKFRFRELKISVYEDVNMDIVGDEKDYGDAQVMDYNPPVIDHGGGGGSNDDTDGDGLSDSLEEAGWYIWVCTSGDNWHHILVTSDPHFVDTDNDGVNDKEEYEHGTNPRDEDTDNDGLTDKQEIGYYGTYAYAWDSDGDEMSDYYEVVYGIYYGGWQEPRNYNKRYAVIIYGDPAQLNKKWYQNLCDSIYNYLVNIGYKDENI
ncbi:hypothetical protein AciM339_0373 [Aciduliprofundum sp. MAR08-339]|uniref:thrombospondin type 3 repeat-containing protein n=1 Tax=Aciduliprofundum sp. (strain MAR08-339) TaxID=673860 RepID=UPI0002A4CABA|nr:hypothetical protein AciM339_0373 [Aciduliprofundum sp. MAR08-339]